MIRFEVISLFPEMFAAVSDFGVSGRAFINNKWQLRTWNPRDFSENKHKSVDDRPYGGGPGMVMLAAPLEKAVLAAKDACKNLSYAKEQPQVLMLSPQGKLLDHKRVLNLSSQTALILVCGRYEGVDQRFMDVCVDEEISIGNFVLSGGELAAMALMDAIIRQLPGVLGDAKSAAEDSFTNGLLDCQHYTRPFNCLGLDVPKVLLSGDHMKIAKWRRQQALNNSLEKRPELLDFARQNGLLSQDDEEFLYSKYLLKIN